MNEQLQNIFSNYDGVRGDMIPILQDIQEVLGYVPSEAMAETARFLNVPKSTVYGVVTFYTQFHRTRQGKHRVKVCLGTACHVRGAGQILEAVERILGIKPGETSDDFLFSTDRVACVGSCALAPVMVIDDKVYGTMTVAKVDEVLGRLKKETEATRDASQPVASTVSDQERDHAEN